jgi:CheY-like chemotaxis protein
MAMSGSGLDLGTILVVDDDPGVCRYVQTVLKRVGYEVDGTEDGDRAIELLKRRRFDLVITDLTMPNVSGMELLESVKAAALDTDVLVMSAAGSIPLAVQAIKLGALNYIEKPIEPTALLGEVRAAFKHRKDALLGRTMPAGTTPRTVRSVPTRIGRYRIERVLGSGGMGTVYAAFDPELDRTVAIKTVQPPASLGEPMLRHIADRFIREARAAAQLTHPNIAAIYDFGQDEESGLTYFAMERVHGVTLNALLANLGALPLRRALKVLYQLADALEFAHRHGIVHRDVKPGNVIVGEADRAKLLDFGVARIEGSELTQSGHLLGSPGYVSPEAALGDRVDHRADQFSLAILFLEMVSNRKVFGEDDIVKTLHLVVSRPAPRLSELTVEAPSELQVVLDRMTDKSPAKRYQDEMALLRDLAGIGESIGVRLQLAIAR